MVCTQFRTKLELMRNYRSAFIDGMSNVRTSTFKEHATTDMHTRASTLRSLPIVHHSNSTRTYTLYVWSKVLHVWTKHVLSRNVVWTYF